MKKDKNKNLLPGGVIGHDGSNAGRPSNDFKQYCQGILEKYNLVERAGLIASGADIEQVINKEGEVIKVPAPISVQMNAIEYITERAHGKSTQTIESDSITEILREMRERIRA